MTPTLDHVLDSLGVGRPLWTGRRWTRADLARAISVDPITLTASRAGTPRGQRVHRAASWALSILGGEIPPEWQQEPEIRALAVAIVRAWAAANGIGEDMLGLVGFLRRWGAEQPDIRAEWLLEIRRADVLDALARESWAGVLALVRS